MGIEIGDGHEGLDVGRIGYMIRCACSRRGSFLTDVVGHVDIDPEVLGEPIRQDLGVGLGIRTVWTAGKSGCRQTRLNPNRS